MKYVKSAATLLVLICIVILCNIKFRMYITPAGEMGEISSLNTVVSTIYIIMWSVLSLFSGLKGYKSIFIGGLIYSILPYFGLLGGLLIPSPLAILILIPFYFAVPLQGLGSLFVFLQLPILLLGYIVIGKIKVSKKVTI